MRSLLGFTLAFGLAALLLTVLDPEKKQTTLSVVDSSALLSRADAAAKDAFASVRAEVTRAQSHSIPPTDNSSQVEAASRPDESAVIPAAENRSIQTLVIADPQVHDVLDVVKARAALGQDASPSPNEFSPQRRSPLKEQHSLDDVLALSRENAETLARLNQSFANR